MMNAAFNQLFENAILFAFLLRFTDYRYSITSIVIVLFYKSHGEMVIDDDILVCKKIIEVISQSIHIIFEIRRL